MTVKEFLRTVEDNQKIKLIKNYDYCIITVEGCAHFKQCIFWDYFDCKIKKVTTKAGEDDEIILIIEV